MDEEADTTTGHDTAAAGGAGGLQPGPAETAINALAALMDAAIAAEGAIGSWAAGEDDTESAAVWARATTLRKSVEQFGVAAARALLPQQVDAGDTIYRYRQLAGDDSEFCSIHLDRPAVGRTIRGPGRGTRRYACRDCWDEAKPWTARLANEYLTSIGWNR